jgi:hypothetical protein
MYGYSVPPVDSYLSEWLPDQLLVERVGKSLLHPRVIVTSFLLKTQPLLDQYRFSLKTCWDPLLGSRIAIRVTAVSHLVTHP